MGEILVADLETNGLLKAVPKRGIPAANQIWMVGILNFDTDQFDCYHGYEPGPHTVIAGIQRMQAADLVIGHHVLGYDIPSVESFTAGLVRFDRTRVIDTLDLSRALVSMDRHRLEDWGEMLGLPKLPAPNFSAGFTPEMATYCERDCRLNKRVFEVLMELQHEREAA